MKAYIYKIKRKDYEFEVYIGQTIQKINERLRQHLRKRTNIIFKEWVDTYVGNIEITLIEEYDYENILDIQDKLNERETYWIDFYKNKSEYKCFNQMKGVCIRKYNNISSEEVKKIGRRRYYNRHKNKINDKRRENYKDDNIKNKIQERNLNSYYKFHEKRLEYKNEYYQENKKEICERSSEYRKEYRKKNKDKLNEQQRERRSKKKIKNQISYK